MWQTLLQENTTRRENCKEKKIEVQNLQRWPVPNARICLTHVIDIVLASALKDLKTLTRYPATLTTSTLIIYSFQKCRNFHPKEIHNFFLMKENVESSGTFHFSK